MRVWLTPGQSSQLTTLVPPAVAWPALAKQTKEMEGALDEGNAPTPALPHGLREACGRLSRAARSPSSHLASITALPWR